MERAPPAAPPPPPWIYGTLEQLAAYLGVEPKDLQGWMRAGLVPDGDLHPTSQQRYWRWDTALGLTLLLPWLLRPEAVNRNSPKKSGEMKDDSA